MTYDKIILGAGLYGLYSAVFCARLSLSAQLFHRHQKRALFPALLRRFRLLQQDGF